MTPPTTNSATPVAAAFEVVWIRVPVIASSAGSRVIDASIITSTPIALEMARPFTKAMPINSKPSSEMITVMPANTTARPDESTEATIAVSGSSPIARCSRNRLTMNKA